MGALRRPPLGILAAGGVLWGLMVIAGFVALIRYSLSPGRSGAPPQVWPAESRLRPEADRLSLLLVVHPHCPCTQASVQELKQIMTASQGRLSARVLFVRPRGVPDPWAKTPLWSDVQAIPGVTPVLDADGVEAGRFGAFTSGQAVLYDSRGRLLFSGGITGARGETGPNAGVAAVLEALKDPTSQRQGTAVYGCPLTTPIQPTNHGERTACPTI